MAWLLLASMVGAAEPASEARTVRYPVKSVHGAPGGPALPGTAPLPEGLHRLKVPGAAALRIGGGSNAGTPRLLAASGRAAAGDQGWVPGDTVYLRAGEGTSPDELEARVTVFSMLARRWAPTLMQDVVGKRASWDWITAADYDGDWDMTNNWESLPDQEDGPLGSLLHRAVVYWWAVETETHYFLGYAWYHPRDWEYEGGVGGSIKKGLFLAGRQILGKGGSGEHENDLEGLLLTLRKGGPGTPVKLELMETQAHDNFWSYGNDDLWEEVDHPDKGKALDDLDGMIRLDEATSRPTVFIEARGHGAYGSPKKTDFDGKKGDGVIYRYQPAWRAPPDSPGVDYALVPIDEMWERFHEVPPGGESETFIRPEDSRPAFRGDTRDDNAANPPWAWQDKDYPDDVNRAFFTDPARFVAARFRPRGDRPFSLEVVRTSFPRLDLTE